MLCLGFILVDIPVFLMTCLCAVLGLSAGFGAGLLRRGPVLSKMLGGGIILVSVGGLVVAMLLPGALDYLFVWVGVFVFAGMIGESYA